MQCFNGFRYVGLIDLGVTAPWGRQDVLARARSTVLDDDEHCVSLSAAYTILQDCSWYDLLLVPQLVEMLNCPGSDQIKRHARESQKFTYSLILVPRTSTLVTRILEEEGVLGDVTISSYNLQFIPTEEDVLSLEVENAFKEIWVVSVLARSGSIT